MAGSVCAKVQELEENVRVVIYVTVKSRLIAAFRELQRIVDEYIKKKRDYIEQNFVPRFQFLISVLKIDIRKT
jgi:hypothetical protein